MASGVNDPPPPHQYQGGKEPPMSGDRVVVFTTAATVREKIGVRSLPVLLETGQEGENPELTRVKGIEVLRGRGVEGQVKVKTGGV